MKKFISIFLNIVIILGIFTPILLMASNELIQPISHLANDFNNNETIEQSNNPPIILSASVEPTKVQPGDVMLVKAEIKDDYGIESVTADMGGIEIIDLELVNGTIYNGIYQAEWLVHDTEVKNYITTITATNVKGLSSSVEKRWSDPIETLRPNAVGDETNIASQTPDSGAHWEKVDDTGTGDGTSTIVHTTSGSYQRDLYNIENHSAGSGTINKITVFFRFRTSFGGFTAYGKAAIKSGTTIDEGSEETEAVGNFTLKSKEWATNPDTSSAWTWDEIDALQIGVALKASMMATQCTQVYVEVDYTANTAPNTPTLSSPSDGAVGQSLTPDLVFNYSDSDSDNCTKFDLKVDNNSDFSSCEINVTDYSTGGPWASGAAITYSVSSGLSYGTKYYWKARVYDGTDWSNWSDGTWDFTTKTYMSSDNYKMIFDSINFGGTENSLSTNYKLSDTMGEIGTGVLSSSNYKMKAGYRQGVKELSLTFSLSNTSSDFGTISSTVVNASNPNVTLTVSTNASSGFNISVQDEGNGSSPGLYNSSASHLVSSITALLSSGTEGYGIQASSATGVSIDSVYDKAGNNVGGLSRTSQTLASQDLAGEDETVIINHKAAISGATSCGGYTDTITYICTGSF